MWSGEIATLVERLRRTARGDVWVIGGSDVQQQFLEAGGLDRIEIHVIPLLIGDGVPLWPRTELRHRLTLKSATAMAAGMVRLDYAIARSHPAA